MSRIVVLLLAAASLTLLVTLALDGVDDAATLDAFEPVLRAATAHTTDSPAATPALGASPSPSSPAAPDRAAKPSANVPADDRADRMPGTRATDEDAYESPRVTSVPARPAGRVPFAPDGRPTSIDEAPDADVAERPGASAHASYVPSERPVTAPGDTAELRPWLAELTPGEDRASAPVPGTAPSENAVEDVAQDKPATAIDVTLVIDARGLDGVAVRVNGRRVGTAPAELSLRLPRPGDLVVVFTKPGYAEETHQLRLGQDHPGGRVHVSADMQEDGPSEAAVTGPQSRTVEEDSDEAILDD